MCSSPGFASIVDERRGIAREYARGCRRLPGVAAAGGARLGAHELAKLLCRAAGACDQRAVMQRMLDGGVSTRRGVMNAHLELPYRRKARRVRLQRSEHAQQRANHPAARSVDDGIAGAAGVRRARGRMQGNSSRITGRSQSLRTLSEPNVLTSIRKRPPRTGGLEKTEPMTYKRALITGGAGLIGSHIADRLVAEGFQEIVVLDNFTRGRRQNLEPAMTSGRVTIIAGDIRDPDVVLRAMEGIDIVFHEAAIRITHCAENPRLAHDVLATGTFNVLEAAVAANVKRVVSASSASIYGQAEEFPTNEKHHGYGNRTIYGATKSYSEGLLRSFYEMYGLNYVALRYFNVYGPRMDAFGVYTEVMIRWMERLAKGQPCLILGDGAQTMDFVFVTDIARANLRAANSSITDDVLNIASGTETSLTELATRSRPRDGR